VLLDQGKLVCGVGNWVADEVLYQAGVLPSAACNTLSDLTLTPSRSLNRLTLTPSRSLNRAYP